MKYTNLQVEQMTSFIIFESAHINITPCVNLDTGGENIHTVLLSQFTEEYREGLKCISRYLFQLDF